MNASLRKNFENELKELEEKLDLMCDKTINMYGNVIKSLENNDKELALDTIKKDHEINELNDEINNEAVIIIAKQGPVAIDLRTIITIIKISTEVERIADYTKNISNYVLAFSENQTEELKILNKSFIKAIEILKSMLAKIMNAYKNDSLEEAKVVANLDDEIDDIYRKNLELFIGYIQKTEDKEKINKYLQGILVNKHLERAGDHITNIVEEVMYYIKGKRYRL